MKIHAIFKVAVALSLPLLTFSLHSQVFIENKGQVLDFHENLHPEVLYYYSDHSAAVYFQDDRLVYHFSEKEKIDLARFENDRAGYEEALRSQQAVYHRMDMVFQNAQPDAAISTGKQNQGVTHYYLNKRNGIRDVRSFASIKYENIYPNIDAVFYHTPNGLKYDLVLKPGADINDIQLRFEGATVSIKDKKLILSAHFKDLTEEIPLSFINEDPANAVEVDYVLHKDGTVGFQLKDKVNYTTLTIDPVLEWGSYFNLTSGTSNLYNIANHLDNDGNYYTYGMAQNTANTYPVINPGGAYTSTANGSADAYFVKFNADRQLVWSTYLGGSGYDEIYDGDIITTRGNTLHLVGERITTGAPFTNGGGFFQNNAARNFWARFNKNTGVLEHLTSLSSGYKPSIAISNSGLVAISNDAYDFNNLPILNRAGAYNQAVNGGTKDMGLLLFNATYTQTWGTFLGGTGAQENFTCAFDNNDNLYFVGETSNNASLVTLPGAYNQNTPGGGVDVMLGKFTNTGQLVWNTLYGGNGSDARRGQQGHGARIVVHPANGELILAFNTTSNNLPVTNLAGAYNKGVPTDPDFGGSSGSFWNYAAYLCKFSTTGALNYSTYYYTQNGGGDIIENIAFGGCDKFYIGSAGISTKQLTGASSGYNLIQGTSSSRSGYITMLNSATFAFEWDSYMNTDVSSEANVAANINQPEFYTVTTLYYQNLPVTDPGNGAYYAATSSNPAGAGVGISQFHPSLPPEVDDASICSGASVTLTASGGMGAPYNWYSSAGAPTPLHTGATYAVNPSATTTYYVSSGTGMCASPRVPVTVTVTPVTAGTAIASPASACSGSTITLTLSGHSGTIQWQSSTDGGTTWNDISGATATPYIANNVSTSTSYRAVVTDGSCSGNSNEVSITITPSVTPGVAITGTPVTAICAGTSVTFTANPTNGGASPAYQWQVNGTDVAGETGSTFTTTSLNNGDQVTVIMTSNAPCASPATASGTTTTISVTPAVVPGVSITGTPGSAICAGTSVTFTANPVNGGSAPTYQWQVNGTNVPGETGGTFTTSSLNNGDQVTVIMTSNAPCASPANASFTTTAITVNPAVTPSVSITGTPGSAICSGTSVTFTANPVNGGSSPAYQWQVNGTDVSGETGSTFTTSSLNDGDEVTVILYSNATCASPASASATTTAISVTPSVVPSVNITGDPVTGLCAGSTINLTANPVNGGASPTYQWQINGVNVAGATNSTFSTTGLNNGDVITVIMVSNAPCASPATATDDTPAVVIVSSVTPAVTITGIPASAICAGTSITFTANPVNGGSSPAYQWQVNGVDVAGETGSTFTTSALTDGDIVSVVLTSNDPCASPVTATDDTGVIQVGDDQDPVFTDCPADITISSGGSCDVAVTWTAPTATDNCSVPSVTSSHNPGETFSAGTTQVTYTATDAAGNTVICSFNVTVEDDIDPVFTDCQGDTTLSITADNCEAALPDYLPFIHATDNCTGAITYIQQPAPGTIVSTTDGSVTITVTAMDASGNQAVCSFEVTIIDNVPQANAGSPVSSVEICRTMGSIDLATLLPNDADPGGSWSNVPGGNDPGNALNGSVLNLQNLSGGYSFYYIVGNCKPDTAIISVNVIPSDDVSPGTPLPSTPFCPKDNATIDLKTLLSNETSWGTWSTTGSASTYLNPDGTLDISSLENGIYTFTHTISNGICGDTSVTVMIQIECKDLDIPNYVTPDGDGTDDVFVIAGIENYPDNELTIFNRWGTVVYQTTNYQNNWDGRSTSKYNVAGDELPTGTYYYVLDTQSEVHGVKTGFIYLER